MPEVHNPAVGRSHVAAVGSRSGIPCASTRSDCDAHAVVKALAVHVGLDPTTGGRGERRSAQG